MTAPTARDDGGPGAALEVRDLKKTYPNGTEAVRGVSFSVTRGEIYGILGPNGAGKSTTIGILGTLVRPTGGNAFIDGLDVTEHGLEVRKRIGFAMQEAGVDELATGLEYLVLQARLYGINKGIALKRAKELITLFELEGAAEKRIGAYSGGMKRRIDLAAALIHVPRFIFLDEPTEGLDPRSRQTLWHTIKRLNQKMGSTILLSTHYMEEADFLCDRIAILSQGKIVAEDTPANLKASVGGQSIALRYSRAMDDATAQRVQEAVRSTGLVERVQPMDGQIFAYVKDAAAATPTLLRALDQARLAPDSLSIHQPTLNDVYLKYTGKTLEAAEAKA